MRCECDIIAASPHLPPHRWHKYFFNPSLLLLSLLQHGRITLVTTGNQQHPSITEQDFICDVHWRSWSSRGQWSHTNTQSPASPVCLTSTFTCLVFTIFVSCFLASSCICTSSFFCSPLPLQSTPSSLSLSFSCSLWCWRELNYTAMSKSWNETPWRSRKQASV